jgi:hypothetical protein
MKDSHITTIQLTSFLGAFVSSYTPLVSLIFMAVSIVTGLIFIYKFLRGKK